MNADTTQSQVDANCKMIRQLKWLQQEYWDSYQHEINKLVSQNEDLLKKEVKAQVEAKHG